MLEKYLNNKSFVELELSGSIPEENISTGIPFINEERITILDIYILIQRIKKSSSSGIIIKLKNINIGLARADEIRTLLFELRSAGKKVYAYLEDAGNIEYFIATAADKIFIPPWSTLNVIGLSFDSFYIKELLDEFHIEAEIDGIGEYKSAADMFKRNSMSPQHREMMNAVLDNFYNSFTAKISASRNISNSELKKLIDKNPLNPVNAKTSGLIDEIIYENEIEQHVVPELGVKPKIIKYKKFTRNYRYSKLPGELIKLITNRKKYIGYVNVNGMITQGESKKGSGYVNTCGSDTLTGLLRKVSEDKSVVAVIIRVLSPGGSALASDLIRHEINTLQEKKPVFISMSDVAASGGYMVSLSSNSIYANPFTITGSIGVVAGKFNFKNLLNRYGIYSETLKKGKMADIYSVNKGFTAEEKKKFMQLIKDMYKDFVELVSDKRKMDSSQTEKAARGRVWSSEDSLNLGLIDNVGSLSDIVNEIKDKVETADDEILYFREFKAKNKLSISNFGKLTGPAGRIENVLELPEILGKERLFTVVPYSCRVR